MPEDTFVASISRQIWDAKYRYREDGRLVDATIEDTWRRVARALASVEGGRRELWEERFYQALEGFKFLPGGRILAGAGTNKQVTLFNCFVMGTLEDTLDGIFEGLKEGALTMQQGGGVGYDFSTLRPQGWPAKRTGAVASGPVSFMRIWDSMCATLLSTGSRRGAMMATLRCDHPDVERFIRAKQEPGELRNFNLSVLVTDAFLEAVRDDLDWPLLFPLEDTSGAGYSGETLVRAWPGHAAPVPCRVERRVSARGLWRQIVRATHEYAEPGVLFIDRINASNNLWYRERISATNPCGEVPLPPYGACDLGAINLTCFVREPFTPAARLDLEAVIELAATAVRMLDNVIDVSGFPLTKQQEQACGSRRIGLGVTGLGDALLMLGLPYDSEAARALATTVLRDICHGAYRTSVALSREKGPFPFLDRQRYLEGPFVSNLPAALRRDIERHGIRNSHLLSIAPTGTISLLANNISSGIEPVFDFSHSRRVIGPKGRGEVVHLKDYALVRWEKHTAGAPSRPPWFVAARDISPDAHLRMQAALQPYVDNAISKTINLPETAQLADIESLYLDAFRLGLKGCTLFRPNPVTGSVLASEEAGPGACCSLEREGE